MMKINGNVVLTKKKNPFCFNSLYNSVRDSVSELFGDGVSLQLISAVNGDPARGLQGKLGKPAYLKIWNTKIFCLTEAESLFEVTFDWDEEIGVPGAFIIKNNHSSEFYLETVTLEDVPGHGRIHFVCNSWVYPANKYNYDRVFFTNKTYLPSEMPEPLRKFRDQELVNLRGNGTGKLEKWDRVYDYDYYNDLGNPDKDPEHARPVLGGSIEYPYPRRGRTGRPPTQADHKTESRLPLPLSLNIYVPRDERFTPLKLFDSLSSGGKAAIQFLPHGLEAFVESHSNFNTFEDVLKLYKGGIDRHLLDKNRKNLPCEIRTDGKQPFNFPLPQVIKEDPTAWRTDEEFGREMLAGINPVVIRRLQEFPPRSKLDPKVFGNQNSSINKEHIENNLIGSIKPEMKKMLTIDEAIQNNKLFILDHHDALMPYLSRINNNTSTKTYATRTILFLEDDGTLKPLAIELSLPHEGNQCGSVSKVYTPARDGVEGSIWELAKAYVAINDSGFHQLVSHWLNTHAAMEPFVIATNRQLSVLHPIYKLLHPHFRDTMNINALAREILINAGGGVENTVFPAKYSMELSATVYKNWVFPEQALPADLIKRGVAVEDSESPHGLRLLIEDYPYAVDGLEIWSAIKTWVQDYCSYYYTTDDKVQKDSELQSWWKEVREKGHGDKKDERWWPKLHTLKELIETCTTIIWVASALHAAVNFGQYPYGGYLPNRPSVSRRFMPERGSPEYSELESNPEKAYFETITPQLQTLIGMSLIEILSIHSKDEVYLGQPATPEWTSDEAPLKAFKKFGEKLEEIEKRIMEMNKDERWRNRVGPVKMPYTLLCPSSGVGLTGKGIPNSVSI